MEFTNIVSQKEETVNSGRNKGYRKKNNKADVEARKGREDALESTSRRRDDEGDIWAPWLMLPHLGIWTQMDCHSSRAAFAELVAEVSSVSDFF